jgi:hypothetical protein
VARTVTLYAGGGATRRRAQLRVRSGLLRHADAKHGVRAFVVGTGGESRFPLSHVVPNLQVGNADTFDVLKLGLQPDHYTWQFLPAPGSAPNGTFTDSGTCR